MDFKKTIKKSTVLFCICYICVQFSTISIIGKAATTAPITVEFAPELVPGSNFTWKVNEWLDMDDWLNPESTYIPMPGDLWFMEIKKDLPSLNLDGLISWNISDWYYVEIDASLDVEENFEYNISGHDFISVFGEEGNPSHNWKMVNRLFILPYFVSDQTFGDFYSSKLDAVGAAYTVTTDVQGSDLSINGNIATGEVQEDSFELNASVGVTDSFVYKKKPFGHEAWKNIVNISLVESYIPDPEPSIPGYTYLAGLGLICIGVITVLVQRQISKGKKK